MEETRISYLAGRYLSGAITAQELEEFYALVRDGGQDEALKAALAGGWAGFATQESIPAARADEMFQSILRESEGLHEESESAEEERGGQRKEREWDRLHLRAESEGLQEESESEEEERGGQREEREWAGWQVRAESEGVHEGSESPVEQRGGQSGPAKVVVIRTRRVIVYAASFILFAFALWLLINHTTRQLPKEVGNVLLSQITAPDRTRATLTLAGGQRIYLDSTGNSMLAVQDHINIRKTAKGAIVYEGNGGGMEPMYNSLFNPRGSRPVSVTLSDGTKVWLNAESSLTYPVVFSGGERKVTVSGEAYFEVTHQAASTFKVVTRDGVVDVLGTHFNVNDYDDETALKVTLLQGSVRVSVAARDGASAMIRPGEQARLNTKEGLEKISDVDTAVVMAWKSGMFAFKNEDIGTVLRRIGRWYGLEMVFDASPPPGHITGTVPRDMSLDKMLDAFQLSGIRCSLEGRKMIIKGY